MSRLGAFLLGVAITAYLLTLIFVAPAFRERNSWTCTGRDTVSGRCLSQVRQ